MSDPLVTEITVTCSVTHAFRTWTTNASAWWPRDHSVTTHPDLEVIFEPHVGGRIFERAPDGVEHDWGEVVTWEAPRRLAYSWHIGSERADATEVVITFTDAGDGQTLVHIEHRGWERLGAEAEDRRSANRQRWDALLPRYAEACAETP